jgi:BirA family biotin operon repressor/biotin-[acetyl-CoA-carboxylase] ligase
MRAKELAAGGVPEGTLVVAESQTRGRGRKGRMWLSPPGDGIYASFIIRPPMPPAEASTITLLTAVAVAETLLTVTGLDVHIKWPNDIMIGPRKVAGILTEISTELDLINYVVLGLGLNVNTARFPDEIKDRATSLFLETRSSFSRAPILAGFLKRFEIYYEDAKTHGFGAVLTRWKELSATIGKKITVEMVDAVRAGTVRDLDDHGALMIEDEDGMVHRIVSGDVTMTS